MSQTFLYIAAVTVLSIMSFSTVAKASIIPNGKNLDGSNISQVDGSNRYSGGDEDFNSNRKTLENATTFDIGAIGGNGRLLNGVNLKDRVSQVKTSEQTGLTLSNRDFSSIQVEGGRLVGIR
ncbi:MAG: hypothetical protein RMX96_31655 [Nostoc sp. ChiSLP02]|nr:hypothetical protein [Nostoc sp. DedSLP05]MDZ8100987.1 hypothetical protein [Nostoc sp. DedSLP01]MDZ8189380.1 hypothetical protein [Nostoc sp. ChiSLP02]